MVNWWLNIDGSGYGWWSVDQPAPPHRSVHRPLALPWRCPRCAWPRCKKPPRERRSPRAIDRPGWSRWASGFRAEGSPCGSGLGSVNLLMELIPANWCKLMMNSGWLTLTRPYHSQYGGAQAQSVVHQPGQAAPNASCGAPSVPCWSSWTDMVPTWRPKWWKLGLKTITNGW